VIQKLDAVLAGDENLEAFPDTPEGAFILERLEKNSGDKSSANRISVSNNGDFA
jgi:hypothetical protein